MNNPIILTAEEVFDRLLNVDRIKTAEGQIRFYLGDVDIIVKQKDVVGNIIQEWLEGWLRKNNIAFDIELFQNETLFHNSKRHLKMYIDRKSVV